MTTVIPNSSVTYHPQGDTHVEVYDWEGNPLEVADVYLSFNTVVVKLMPPLDGGAPQDGDGESA